MACGAAVEAEGEGGLTITGRLMFRRPLSKKIVSCGRLEKLCDVIILGGGGRVWVSASGTAVSKTGVVRHEWGTGVS